MPAVAAGLALAAGLTDAAGGPAVPLAAGTGRAAAAEPENAPTDTATAEISPVSAAVGRNFTIDVSARVRPVDCTGDSRCSRATFRSRLSQDTWTRGGRRLDHRTCYAVVVWQAGLLR